eukprot:scaffold8374_cov175-Amphora_coffeaeformis.AAC.107
MTFCVLDGLEFSPALIVFWCTLAQVRNAQRVGAAGVLIADNTCLCSATDCQSNLPCEANEPIMADDGSGGDISIPSMLVYKQDADTFKEELMANHPIRLEMTWSLPTPDDRVEYEIWTVPSDPVSKDFLNTFKMISVTLDEKAYFTPHMYIYDGARSNCIGQNNENQCDSLCTNNGRYCATDPDGDLDAGISGAQVVVESLRRLCIWEHYGRKNGVGMEWWLYVEEFDKQCSAPDKFGDITCIEDVAKASGIELELVHRCMRDSGGTNSDAPNNKLDMEISNQISRGVVVIPTAYVNDIPIRGALSTTNVFSAVCAGYAPGTEPKVCPECTRCPDPESCVTTGFCTNGWEHHIINHMRHHNAKQQDVISSHTFFSALLFCMGGVVAMGIYYQKRSHMEMKEQMRSLLAQYMPLDDDDVNSPMDFNNNGGAEAPLLFPEPQEYQGPQGPPQYRQFQPSV